MQRQKRETTKAFRITEMEMTLIQKIMEARGLDGSRGFSDYLRGCIAVEARCTGTDIRGLAIPSWVGIKHSELFSELAGIAPAPRTIRNKHLRHRTK